MPVAPARRKAIVFVSLVGVLTGTTALLLALSPDPLRPEASAALMNAESPAQDPIDLIFQTDKPIRVGRWTSIEVRQSKTLAGDARSLSHSARGIGDHFVICDGDGGADGEIQLTSRWADQTAALFSKGAASHGSGCISICVIGDFDHVPPTVLQMRRLEWLVTTLRTHLGISDDHIHVAGISRWNRP